MKVIVTTIIRELTKLVMFCILWSMPFYLVRLTGNYYYLWLLIGSFICVVGLFSHYEDLERIDSIAKLKQSDDESQDVGSEGNQEEV